MRTIEHNGRKYKLRFGHERYDLHDQVVYAESGRRIRATTFAELIDLATYTVLASAEAQCSWGDNFSKGEGRHIAMQRLVNPAIFPRDFRRAIWTAYWQDLGYKVES